MFSDEYLSEAEIRIAIKDCNSLKEAIEYCGVGNSTFRKYASKYIDKETGLNLLELLRKTVKERKDAKRALRHQKVPKIKKKRLKYSTKHNTGWKEKLEDILLGKHPSYSIRKLRKRLLTCGWFHPRCECCGYDSARPSDKNVPLVISFRNRNWRDCRIENIRLICFNCLFVYEMRTVNQAQQGWSYAIQRRTGRDRVDGRPRGYGGKRFKEQYGEEYFIERKKKEFEAREKRQNDAIAISELNKDLLPEAIFPKLEAWGRMTGTTVFTSENPHPIHKMFIDTSYDDDIYDPSTFQLEEIRVTDADIDEVFDEIDQGFATDGKRKDRYFKDDRDWRDIEDHYEGIDDGVLDLDTPEDSPEDTLENDT